MPVVVLLAIVLQTATSAPPPGAGGGVVPPPSTATRASAVRAATPVVIDGRDEDEVWRKAPPITQFREFQPKEDGNPRFATEAKVAYDDRYFYVFIRAFDPHPDSILKLLARRDVRAATDQLKIMVDSYHDRRSGFEFAVNPAGVKRDYAMYNDSQEDDAWDAVWDVGTQVDSLGWTAEFRIPLSQLRYVPGATNTFGFAVWRDIQRYSERVSWPVYRGSQAGISSQLGELVGLDGLPSPRRPEIAPYVVTKNVSVPTGGAFDRAQKITGGADLKYGFTPSLTLDATVNPDFGQVEADPAVLNLTAFETFFQERRPFFVQGAGIFRFDVNCSAVNDCSTGEGLFYSRRIGRAPQLGFGDPEAPTATTIYGAAKLTGRLPGGQTIGVLDAITQRAGGTLDSTAEPTTNYAVVRGQQDFHNGESGIGIMLTAVNRNLDQRTESVLRRRAYVGAVDFRHRFLRAHYQISGSLDLSTVAGTPSAIAATQLDPVHYYQRPGAGVGYDPTTTSLAGDAEELKFGKVGGGITRFETSYQRRSQGFELNDLGFLRQADQQSWNTWFAFQSRHPSSFYQTAFWNFNWWQFWTAAGTAVERAANTNVHAQLNNRWWVHGGVTAGQLGATFCDRDCTRGGPAVRVDPYLSVNAEVDGDERPAFTPYVWFGYWRGDAGRSERFNGNVQVAFRVASQFRTTLTLSAAHNVKDVQPRGVISDTTPPFATHYTFAHLNQKEVSLTGRVDYTLSPTLTFQLYAQPFVSKGTLSSFRELADPNAAVFDDRYKPYAASPGGFNFKAFNSTTVLRWEYRPGSTLFVVWTQGRQDFAPAMGPRSIKGDFQDLFELHPNNTFLMKASYWINW
ncbi:MAG: hypothetical protein DMD60_12075 [Gemmatimonadetes bacterium]|nr:MAG: hypothetical protein DMD60_12075 [Gemmatimonadota bacterium]